MKGALIKKKKKKRATPLKKHLLAERLARLEKKAQEEDEKGGPVEVCVDNYIFSDDVDDEDELEEIMSDLKGLMGQFGSVEHLALASTCEPWRGFLEAKAHGGEQAGGTEKVVVRFTTREGEGSGKRSCRLAVAAMDGMVIGGQKLSAWLIDPTDGTTILRGNQSLAEAPPPLVPARNAQKFLASSSSSSSCWTLEVEGVISGEQDLVDEEEVHEILSDFYALCGHHETAPLRLWVEQEQAQTREYCGPGAVAWGGLKRADYLVVMDVLDAAVARRVVSGLHGKVVQGIELEVLVCTADGKGLTVGSNWREEDVRRGASARLAIAAYLTQADVEEMGVSGGLVSAELIAARMDLLELAITAATDSEGKGEEVGRQRATVGVLCRSLRGFPGSAAVTAALSAEHTRSCTDRNLLICASFASAMEAQQAMVSLEGAIMGGSVISCELKEVSREVWTAKGSAKRRQFVVDASAALEQSAGKERGDNSATKVQGGVKAPRVSGPARLPRVSDLGPPAPAPDEDGGGGGGSTSHMRFMLAGGGTDSMVCKSNEEQDVLTKALLKDLARFQENALAKNPVKAKADPRFVMGLKQCTHAIKLGRARLVLLAHDHEASEALDEKLRTLVHLAANKLDDNYDPVPVLCSLSRRQLGRALNTNMRQAAVAIFNPDGAYAEFKKIVAYVRKFQEERAAVAPGGGGI